MSRGLGDVYKRQTIVLTVLLLAVVVPAINNAITQAGQNHGGY